MTFEGPKAAERFRALYSLSRFGAVLSAQANKRTKEDVRREVVIDERLEAISAAFEEARDLGTVPADLLDATSDPTTPVGDPMRFLRPSDPPPQLRLEQPAYDVLVSHVDLAVPKCMPSQVRTTIDLVDFLAAATKEEPTTS